MIAKTISHVVFGVEALRVDIEVDAFKGVQPSFNIVGLPDMAVRESADLGRVALAT